MGGLQWEDIGGMDAVRSEILDTITLPLEHPELFASGARWDGVVRLLLVMCVLQGLSLRDVVVC